ncbi:molecular chaperone [Tatumella punctata]|uniref:Molecular chaperone n=1 Tax=Tatumella punctata TaxID=399969 RepID=A0ABW1VQL5_9GAMM
MTGKIYFYSALIIYFLISPLTYAASLQVYPVNINFSVGENVKAIYVNNTGVDPISAQVRVYQWTQKNGSDVLSETHSLLVSPPITAIPPGKQQLLRVILPVPPAGGEEQAYRLVVDELPGTSQNGNQTVRFLLRYDLPVFINTPASVINLSQVVFHLDTSAVPERLWIENNSSQHLKLSNVVLSSAGHHYPVNKGLLGYVLAKSTRSWTLPKGHYSGSTLTFNVNDNAETQTVPVVSP